MTRGTSPACSFRATTTSRWSGSSPSAESSSALTDSGHSIDKCTDLSAWDAFVAASPHGSIFCRTPFLTALGVDFDLWVVSADGQPQVGAVVLRRGGDLLPAPYPFTMYQGVLLAATAAAAPPHERFRRLPELLDFTLRELSERYPTLSFCLHHAFEDLRGFQWFHYDEPHLGRFRVELQYTGLLDLGPHESFDHYLGTIRTTNRQLYRKTLHEGLTVEASADVDVLDRLHAQTFERQGVWRTPQQVVLLRSITAAALIGGFGELLVCREPGGEAVAATLFLHDERCGYYLFAGSNPQWRRANGGRLLVLENIRRCFARGLEWVDMCGVNSPKRGDFKTSFNAIPVPYFIATWETSA